MRDVGVAFGQEKKIECLYDQEKLNYFRKVECFYELERKEFFYDLEKVGILFQKKSILLYKPMREKKRGNGVKCSF